MPAPISLPDDWPELIRDHLAHTHGMVTSVEPAGGMSGAQVYRVYFTDTTVIVKVSPRPAESQFYAITAPILRAHGINVPDVELNTEIDGQYWLVLEYIPIPLPKERRGCDPEMQSMLGRLHTLDLDVSTAYQPEWTAAMTDHALSALGDVTTNALTTRLHALRQQYQHIFAPECLISADPNPANWGLRANGDPVLFDWERLTCATPAIDLGITVPLLSTLDQYRCVASTYLRQRELINAPYSVPEDQLIHDIYAAKLWTVVEFLHEHQQGMIHQPDVIAWIWENIEGWLATAPI
jgi:hypothetical protein